MMKHPTKDDFTVEVLASGIQFFSSLRVPTIPSIVSPIQRT